MWHPYGDPVVGPLVSGLGLGILFPILFLIMVVWAFAWKAIGLYHAARNGQRVWFIVLLIVNTFGILEIVYLKWFQKDMGANRTAVFPFLKEARGKFDARMNSSSVKKEGKSEE